MVNDSSIGLTGLLLLAVYGYGYLMPGTGMSLQLARNVARGEAARFDQLSMVDRELEAVRMARANHSADSATPDVGDSVDPARF